MMRSLLASVLLIGAGLPALAVQPAPGEVLAKEQSYRFWLPDAVKSLDPQKNVDAEGAEVIRQLFEGLMDEDASGAMQPGVASSYEVSDDRLSYVFQLRPDAKWSNGDPVTANDFVYAWRRLADPDTASENAWRLELMHVQNAAEVLTGKKKPAELGVKALDAHRLQVVLSQPAPYFLKTLAHPATYPVHRKSIEAAGEGWTAAGKLVGNGAYVLRAHDLGVSISLEKNPKYRDAAHVLMQKVTGVTIADPAQALRRYREGGLDRVQIPAGDVAAVRAELPGQTVISPYACTYSYLVNLSDTGPAALRDTRVRQALAYAIQPDVVVDRILQGGQKPAASWTHWAIAGFQPPVSEQAGWTDGQRQQKARALLEAAGFGPKHPLKLVLSVNASEDDRKLAAAAVEFWKSVSVQVSTSELPWKQLSERLQSGEFQLARYAWCADYDDASSFLNVLRASGPNYGKYASADYERLLTEAEQAADPARAYTAAEALLARDMPLIPLYHYAKAELIRPEIRGLPNSHAMGEWWAKDLYRVAP
ncbi:oligopeptide ABC transporter substrate-binding protein OppA [Paracoccus limosus]|uniref:Oligopeptide ABC transporter substrate-binding protein OppA n=1 Tax=Paracoccus limosus TaxID=913252 RepID=A0A844H6F1_9RHOB|nr:peptide ABC transporter substrate-binding protein [Paracoccus limosus]MTH35194.1 oligopeptide ABC transporter substrate-binding protein OppA [Paracoccus limosus]